MTAHTLKREYEGRAEMKCCTPTCSCGWRGIGYHAYNDYQHAMVKDQEGEHLREAIRTERAAVTDALTLSGAP